MRVDSKTIADAGLKGVTVGAVMRETLGTTLAFVSWYLEQGADQIIICFDDPEDPAIGVLEPIANVLCLPCTDQFWSDLGLASDTRFAKRQNRAMDSVYHALHHGWFLTVDGDELVYLIGRSLVEELAATPPDVRSVTLRPAEAVQPPDAPNAKPFRLEMNLAAVRAVYGAHAGLMRRRRGLTGHTIGKTASRVGITDVIVRQHFLQARDGTKVLDRTLGTRDGAYLLHFITQGYDIWRAKLPWRLTSSGFAPRTKAVLQPLLDTPGSEPQLREIYEALHVFGPERRAILEAHDALLEVELDIDGLIKRRFADALGDLEGPVKYAS